MTIYSAVIAMAAIGGGAVAIDLGRMSVLRSQLQETADARAMAAAVELDGRDGAQTRATQIATSVTTAASSIAADGHNLSTASTQFYRAYGATTTLATGDGDSQYVKVTLTTKRIDFLLRRVLGLLAGGAADNDETMTTVAVARSNPYICHAPPLMICDFEEGSPPIDLRDVANSGRQVRLKEPQSGGNGSWAPGNFGLLSLPDGSSGASAIESALAAVTPANCYKYDVTTATGSKTNKIKDAINARFDVPGNSWPSPAPNVINYPRDSEIIADSNAKLGSGNWDLTGYWSAKHGGVSPPADLAGASRYQVYLYELGLPYARNGKQTLYPVPDSLPAGFNTVTPPAANIPVSAAHPTDNNYDGVPTKAVASNGQARRIVEVVQLECVASNVHGKGTYPTHSNYLNIFVTETVQDPPEAAIYGEVISAVTGENAPDFHANVALIQ